MVEKKEGAIMDCLNCGNELKCGWSKPSDTFKQKLQWQNKNGKAHYKFENGDYLCIGEDGEVIEKETVIKNDHKVEQKPIDVRPKVQERTVEQRLIDSVLMVDALWKPALEKAKEVYKIPSTVTEPQTNKDVMILAQVIFKAMVEQYTSGEKCLS